MGDFLHLAVKRRSKEEEDSFLDALYEEYRLYKDDPQNVGHKLRDIVNIWLREDDHIDDSYDLVNPLNIAATIMNRVCEIAGHVWVEFVEDADGDDSIRGTAAPRRDVINAHVAEFNPEFDVDLMLEVFEAAEGDEIPWGQITNEHLLKMFAHLLGEFKRAKPRPPKRAPAGSVPGHPNLLTPAQVREQPTAWFNDRREAYLTPAWEVTKAHAVIATIIQQSVGLRYSFTPEHKKDWANCVTWACVILDALAAGWLDTIRAQSVQPARLAPEKCEDYDIRDYGRMRCAEWFASLADARRRGGLRRFA